MHIYARWIINNFVLYFLFLVQMTQSKKAPLLLKIRFILQKRQFHCSKVQNMIPKLGKIQSNYFHNIYYAIKIISWKNVKRLTNKIQDK